ncbi:succinyl-diaminopimelate desuccinylase [Staphylococcus agnetis]|uniref:M20 family metallopeptidase n=1 Tax=Staphylococcus agnetis TaxID=985762 RepID=UPI000D1B2677|nr:M20/M25/M40 family metallo-hydrolase [Staphylococcus agnetis]PTH63831.1 succinyl-diaminopimelate desuccinylase [Staphylococcus agnetis]
MTETQQLLEQFVSVDSSNIENTNHLIHMCNAWLQQNNIETTILSNQGYDILIAKIGKGDKKIILNGHLDVVPAQSKLFTPRIQDDKMYGRGTADMKGGVVGLLLTMKRLHHLDLNTQVELHLVPDEETGGQFGARYLCEQNIDAQLVIKGSAAHSSRPWEGDNAITKALDIHQRLLNLPFAKASSELYACPSINLAKISGGDVYNKVPDTCVMSYDIRYLPSQSKADIIQQIEALTHTQLDIHLTGPPVTNDLNHPDFKLLQQYILKHSPESTAHMFGQHGFADTRYYSAKGIPAIEFGPSGGHWHGEDEYVILSSIDTYTSILVDFIQHYQ